jgi:hypothetical protein
MSSRRKSPDFTLLAAALGLQPIDAARRILDEERAGRKAPRWVRRAARSITRRASGSGGTHA